jgi:hypothetical protein
MDAALAPHLPRFSTSPLPYDASLPPPFAQALPLAFSDEPNQIGCPPPPTSSATAIPAEPHNLPRPISSSSTSRDLQTPRAPRLEHATRRREGLCHHCARALCHPDEPSQISFASPEPHNLPRPLFVLIDISRTCKTPLTLDEARHHTSRPSTRSSSEERRCTSLLKFTAAASALGRTLHNSHPAQREHARKRRDGRLLDVITCACAHLAPSPRHVEQSTWSHP